MAGNPDQPHERRGDYAQYKLEGQALRLTVRNLYNLDKNNKKVRTEYICDLNVTGEFEDDELHVTYGVRTNELMKDIDGGACHIFTEWYTFVNDKGKLKLSEIMSME